MIVGSVGDKISKIFFVCANTVEKLPFIDERGNIKYIKGVNRLNDRLLIIHDLDKFVSMEDSNQ